MSERISVDIHALTMPKWGLAMTEGLLAAWHVEVGQEVHKGQDLVDIETEKITNVCESPVGGVLQRVLADAGDTKPVGALLAVIAGADVADSAVDAFIDKFNADFVVEQDAAGVEAPEPVTLRVDGQNIRYLELGAGAGAPVLFVHGFGGDLNGWLFNQGAVAEGRRTLAIDLPGHGGSTKSLSGFDVPYLANTLDAFLTELGVGSAHLVGHSLGGAAAAELAVHTPSKVETLTLIASVGFGSDINMGYIDAFIEADRRKQLKPVVEKLFADPTLVNREMLEDLLRFKRIDGVKDILRTMANTVFGGGKQTPSLRDDVGSLGIPVQMIWGTDDQIIPVEHSEGMADRVRVSRLGQAGHMVHMERAATVNELIEAVL